MASSWMEGNCSAPAGLPRAILGVPGLTNGKGPEGGDRNAEITLTFQGKAPNSPGKGGMTDCCWLEGSSDSQAAQIFFFFFLSGIKICPKIGNSGIPLFILNFHASCGYTELLLYKFVFQVTDLRDFGKIF